MATESKVALQEIVSTNPADGSVVGRFPVADPAQVLAAVKRAHTAQPEWNALDVRKRIQVLRRFQRLLHAQKSQVAELISREAGKPVVEALLTEVLVVLDAVRFLRKHAYRTLRPELVPHGNPILKAKRGRLLREPYGVIAIISPWNYPFSIPATETLAALAAGNAVVLKPSEFTPAVATELARLLHQAGVPEDVFQVVIGEGPTGAALLKAPIDKVIFTGSVATGKRIAQAAAQRLLPVVLELGGKDPMIVLADADVDVASSAAVWGAFVNAGQTCLSVERCYVHRSLYDKFLAACVEKTRKLRVGKGSGSGSRSRTDDSSAPTADRGNAGERSKSRRRARALWRRAAFAARPQFLCADRNRRREPFHAASAGRDVWPRLADHALRYRRRGDQSRQRL